MPSYNVDKMYNNTYMYIVYHAIQSTVLAILFYSMPIGHITRNFQAFFQDISYSGIIANGVYKDGTGILTDDKFGPDDAKEYGGEGWVGWSNILTTSSYIDITFAFTGLRKFKDVTLTVNVDGKRSYAAFNRSQIFFAPTNDGFSETSFLQYYPGKSVDSNDPYIRNITLSLCENTARFIKLRLYFGGKWLLITEITFNSGIFYIISIALNVSVNFFSIKFNLFLSLVNTLRYLRTCIASCFVSTQSASVCQGEVFVQTQKM